MTKRGVFVCTILIAGVLVVVPALSNAQADEASKFEEDTRKNFPLRAAKPVSVVCATTDIKAGDVIRESMVELKPAPKKGYPILYVGHPRFILGQRPARDIKAGAMITGNHFSPLLKGDSVSSILLEKDVAEGQPITAQDVSGPHNLIFYEDVESGPNTLESVCGKKVRASLMKNHRLTHGDIFP